MRLKIIFLSFLFAPNGGLLTIALPESSSIHSFQLLLGIVGFIISFDLGFIKRIKSNTRILLLFITFILFSSLHRSGYTPDYAAYKIDLLIYNLLMIFLILASIKNYKELRLLILFGAIQIILGILLKGIDLNVYRIGAGEPILAGRLGGLLLCFSIFYSDRKHLIYRAAFGLLGVLVILLSGTRTVFLAVLIIYLLLQFFNKDLGKFYLKLKTLRRIIVGVFLISVTLFFILFRNIFGLSSMLLSRFTGIADITRDNDRSVNERFEQWTLAVDMWSDNILTGVGTGGYGFYYLNWDLRMYPHNLFLELLSEVGLIGFTLFSIMLYKVWRLLIKRWNYYERHKLNFLISLFLFGFITSMTSLELPNQYILFLSICLILCVNSIESTRPKIK